MKDKQLSKHVFTMMNGELREVFILSDRYDSVKTFDAAMDIIDAGSYGESESYLVKRANWDHIVFACKLADVALPTIHVVN